MKTTVRFFDGKCGAEHRGSLRIDDGCMVIVDEGTGREHARWPLHAMHSGDPNPDGVVALWCKGEPGRVLANCAALPSELPRRRARPRHVAWVASMAVVFAFLAAGAAFVRDPSLAVKLVPLSVEAHLGDAAQAALTSTNRVCEGAAGQAALSALEARLARAAGIARPVSVIVVDDDQINAFALPGRRIVVMKGLIDHASDANQLAGVLAHETAHIANRDPLTGAMRQLGIRAVATMFGVDIGYGDVSSIAGHFLTLSYGREAERAADARGIAYLHAAGLRSDGLAAFLMSMTKREGEFALPPFLSDHPRTDDRVRDSQGSSTGDDAMSDAQWRAISKMCAP
ncbi:MULTISPECIES: M48 family metallopeptidase [unclassified Caballeronia]|uniref:M48 family metallopeptidase n=1 Tax=unclassified Caballeronia TaxID=2646786 RepID=UPI00285F529C|nr:MULTISPECIES: M48 family metallopeptidase [unclassified Caballeronia]MDR5739645.1 M48 family metallopeptidase [Caballeronia sp. LZ016]MDR5808112.1 M48 family metallopeptidase [Caballeronia sp. LZ019]